MPAGPSIKSISTPLCSIPLAGREAYAQLRARAQKIVALETLEAEPVPVKKAAMKKGKKAA
jgi:hypothetical protein